MCLIHLRPARAPSPDPIVPSRPIIIPAPPLSPQSYPRHTSRPTSAYAPSPRVSITTDLKRLSIQSREQWEAARRKEAERLLDEDNARERGYELERLQRAEAEVLHASPRHITQPAAPDPPVRRESQCRVSFQPQQEKVMVFKDENRSPRGSGTRVAMRPDVRKGSENSHGEGPVPSSVSSLGSGAAQGTMGPPAPLAAKAVSNGVNATTGEMGRPQKLHHRRRESSVSVVNGRDGSVLERTTSGQLQVQHAGSGGHRRSASASGRQRPAGGPRRSTGNVSVGSVDGGWGRDPRASARSVREKIVVVDEVQGTRRREYVRYGG